MGGVRVVGETNETHMRHTRASSPSPPAARCRLRRYHSPGLRTFRAAAVSDLALAACLAQSSERESCGALEWSYVAHEWRTFAAATQPLALAVEPAPPSSQPHDYKTNAKTDTPASETVHSLHRAVARMLTVSAFVWTRTSIVTPSCPRAVTSSAIENRLISSAARPYTAVRLEYGCTECITCTSVKHVHAHVHVVVVHVRVPSRTAVRCLVVHRQDSR